MASEAARERDRMRSRRKHAHRSETTRMGHGELSRRRLKAESEELAPVIRLADMLRPKTRGECVDGPRPCPWVSCRHHLFLETNVVKDNGNIKYNFPDLEPDQLEGRLESCSLDVADEGPHGDERIGELMNLTREWVRQLEERALKKIRLPLLRALDPEDTRDR